MIVSICPTFFCNLRCDYCYLGNNRENKSLLDLNILKTRLNELSNIEGFNVFGGEISLLDDEYLNNLNNLLKKYSNNITVNTNLTDIKIFDIFDNVSVSYNYERDNFNYVRKTLKTFDKPFSLSIVVLPSIYNKEPKELLEEINFKNCKSVTFMEYSPALNATKKYDEIDFDDFLIKIYDNYKNFNYTITNFGDIKKCLCKQYNPYMNSNIFIDHRGYYGIVKTGLVEQFKWFNNLQEYYLECVYEDLNIVCNNCPYYRHCYAEHLNKDVCKGHRKLLDYFKDKLC